MNRQVTMGIGGKQRVLHVVISLQPGGLEKLVAGWSARRNRAMPGSVAIACLDRESEDEFGADAPVFRLDARRDRFPWDAAAVRRLRALIRGNAAEDAFDVVHSHNLAAWQYAALANRRTGARHIHTEHGSLPDAPGLRDRLRLRWLERRTNRIVAVSTATANELIHCHGMRRDRLTVIPNGIDMPDLSIDRDELRRRYRAEFNLPANALVLGSVGRLAPIKGYDRLITVFDDIRAQLRKTEAAVTDDLYLMLIGDGAERMAIETLAADKQIGDRIRFAGYRKDARELLCAMDAFVLPSRGEGLSLALLEAMTAGIPALVTDAGDSRRVIDEGAAGILLPDSIQDWPRMIAAQLADRNSTATKQRITNAVQRVSNHYTLENTLKLYEKVYCAEAPKHRVKP